MPVDELVELGLRMGGEALLEVGDDDTRTGAVIRAVVFAMVGAMVAGVLWVTIDLIVAGGAGFKVIGGTVLLAVLGAFLVRRLVVEVHRLRHWGEPVLVADGRGLTLVKRDRVIGWDEIASVRAERRGVRGRVRIALKGKAGSDVFVPTRKPEALAAAILYDDALQGLGR